jgi:hypothetical protein
MISYVTPRIQNALDSMTHDEILCLDAAVTANDDVQVMTMLCNKDFLILTEQDPIMNAMINHNVSWADLMDAMPHSAKNAMEAEPQVMDWDDSPDADWEMPILRLRKHIWENFPVDVVSVQSKDRVERYVIRWNPRKYQDARTDVTFYWEYDDFEDNVYRRLLLSLNASRYWTVEEAKSANDVCIIAMNFQNEKPSMPFKLPSNNMCDNDDAMSVASVASVASASTASSGWEEVAVNKKGPQPAPQLHRLNDIKAHFPVIWNEVQGCKSTTYAVEIFGKKAKEQNLNINRVKADLIAALSTSRAWTVLPAKDPKHVCLIQMNHSA